MRTALVAATLGVFFSMTAMTFGAPMLTITEAYVGVSGDDITEDWFEITNLGDMAWDVNTNPLWYDDESQSSADADPISGLGTIQPGESVIVVVGDGGDSLAFTAAWNNGGNLDTVQVGWSDGAGLGQGGDGIALFDDVVTPNILAYQATPVIADGRTVIYNPNTATFGDLAADGVFDAYVAPGGPAGDAGEYPLIGSPGALPEPATLAMVLLGGLGVLRRRR